MKPEKRNLRIKRLKLENFKRIEVVDVSPVGDVVTIAGNNEQGKSSLLDGIEWILRGKKAQPEQPIRTGQKKARGVTSLCDDSGQPVLTVEREVTQGKESVRVRFAGQSKDAERPQSLLDTFFSLIAFEPLKLADMKPAELANELRRLTGCDVSDLEKRHAALTAERRDVGRDRDTAEKRLAGETEVNADAPLPYPEAPAELVSVTDLYAETERMREVKARNDEQRERAIRLEVVADQLNTVRQELDIEIASLEQKLTDRRALRDAKLSEVAAADAEAKEAGEAAKQLVDPNEGIVRSKILDADRVNDHVRANETERLRRKNQIAKRSELDAAATEMREKYQELTERLREIEQAKTDRIAASKMPIEGLSFGEDGTATFKGLPLAQASQAERYRVFTAIAAAQNPTLRVLILRNAALLDARYRKLFAELATEYGCQCWEEMVDTSIPGAIVLEDGRVKSEPVADTEPAPPIEA